MTRHNRKIMFVVSSLEGGGAEKVASSLLNEFSKSEIDVILVLFSKKTGYDLSEKIKVRYIDVKLKGNFIYTVFKFFYIVFSLVRIIKDERPFNVLSFMDYTNIAVILSRFFGGATGLTISVHTTPTLHFKHVRSFWNTILKILIKLLYNKADKIIAVSKYIRKDLICNFGVEESKTVTIYNPVDTVKINLLADEDVSHPWFAEKNPVILSAGRLSKEKGFDYLLKAFAIVRQKMNVRLMILGSGSEEHFLRELSRKEGVDKDVAFLGHKQNPFMYMRRATIYVLSSLYEGFPVALVEAMACGVPVVSTIYNPGRSEIIENEKNGLLVIAGDEKALADGMLRLLTDAKEREHFANEAKKTVEALSLEKIVQRYREILLDGG